MPNKNKSAEEPMRARRIPYALQQRLSYIEESLFWTGEASRGHLERRFDISNQRAALDFAFYLRQCPRNIEYDASAKRYVPTAAFSPRYYVPAIDAALKTWAPVETVPVLERTCDLAVLRILVQAIRRKQRSRVFYRSLNSETATWRDVSPHTFVFDGQRFHVRVYDHTSKKWCDFVLGRIQQAEASRITSKPASEDSDWNRAVVLTAEPSRELSAISRKALADDYGVPNSTLRITTREALRYYIEVQLGVKSWTARRWHITGPASIHPDRGV